MNANTIRNLLEQKAGKLPKMRSHEELQSLAEFLEQPDTADYLQHCVPDDVIAASGKHIYPGFIITNAQLGLEEVSAVRRGDRLHG